MMDFGDGAPRGRMVGDYVIGRKIGSGSFAVVWKSKHRYSGTEYAIKEIDKKHLNDNLRKEISILRNITHPNIIRLFEAIETDERIYLVLEYCDGGDLGAYIHRHGRISEDIARHFMKQLAAGLQVLREKNLIHRDLKPQNLLLSGREVTPLLKIGDFGFARFLTPQGLADTLCGSPLYMAPEIIQNQRYDAKADLWSVGAICYQLVIGKPPFDGNSQLQLFQNILRSTTLQFPEGALQVLHPEFVEFCRSLLRRNPVERLTFEEFFNHKFLMGPRVAVNTETSSQISRVESLDLTENQGYQSHHDDEVKALEESVKRDCSINDDNREFEKDYCSTSRGSNDCKSKPNFPDGKFKHSVEDVPHSLSETRVAYSMDSIEGEYVFVHSNFASTEILTSSLGTSLKESSATKACALAPKNNDKQLPTMPEMNELTVKLDGGSDNNLQSELNSSTASSSHCIRDLPVLHPSTSLHLIHLYVDALSGLAKEKLNAGFFLESFSVKLVVLTLWKEALRICNSWLLHSGVPESSSGNESARKKAESSSSNAEGITDFTNPSSVSTWAEKGFIDAYDGTEKLSKYIQDVDGSAEMPDAMEIIFQTAIAAGKHGAADEFVGSRDSAAVLYSKALLLFSFIVSEAPSLPLNPPFSLAPDSKQQILKYIKSLEHHLSRSQTSQSSVMKLPSFGIK